MLNLRMILRMIATITAWLPMRWFSRIIVELWNNSSAAKNKIGKDFFGLKLFFEIEKWGIFQFQKTTSIRISKH